MNDIAGAATAAPEPVAQPQDTGSQSAPEPQAQPKIERSKEPPRASIDRAFAEIDKQEQGNKGNGKAKANARDELLELDPDALKTEREDGRDDKGRFKAKEATAETGPQPEAQPKDEKQPEAPKPGLDAPSRFSVDAKAAWATVPDSVKGEVNRAIREMEGGLSQYKQVVEPLKPFIEMANKHDTTVHDALARYTSLDMALASQDSKSKFGAIQELIEYAGLSPKEYAALVMGQQPDQAQAQDAATIRELRNEISGLKQQIGGVTTSIQQRREAEVKASVEAFAKEHTRLSEPEFAQSVTRLIETGMAKDLESAYDMAERLNPAPVVETQQQPAASSVATPKPQPDQTRKGTLSIAGAPASGSNPVTRKPPVSARDALDRAFAGVGIT